MRIACILLSLTAIVVSGNRLRANDVSSAEINASQLAKRRFVALPVLLDTLVDGEKDDRLGRPLLLAVSDSLLAYFDYSDNHLGAVDFAGKLQWRVGRRGQGPGDWGNPTSITRSEQGTFWVNDPGANRAVQVGTDGKVVRSVVLREAFQRISRLADGRILTIGAASGRPSAQLMNSRFEFISKVSWNGWADSALGRSGQVRVAASASGAVAAISIYTGRIMPLRNPLSFDSGVDGVESREFPKLVSTRGADGVLITNVTPDSKPAIRDATIMGQRLFILPVGDSVGGKLLDIYDYPTAKYRASVRLPLGLVVLAANRSELFAIAHDPVPVIVRIRWNERTLSDLLARN